MQAETLFAGNAAVISNACKSNSILFLEFNGGFLTYWYIVFSQGVEWHTITVDMQLFGNRVTNL